MMSANSGVSETLTLWKLLNDYKVVVPRIQRDYAQGRKLDDIRSTWKSPGRFRPGPSMRLAESSAHGTAILRS